MHLNHLVVAIQKTNGDTLRESDVRLEVVDEISSPTKHSKRATVYLPFDTEYSLFFKNTADTRAVLDIIIDGTSVLGGDRVVVEPHSESRLERFLLDGNLKTGKRFKFVALDDPGVQNPSEPKNGLVEVVCRWELPVIQLQQIGTPVVFWPEFWPIYRRPIRKYPTDYPYFPYFPEQPIIWSNTSLTSYSPGTVGASSNFSIAASNAAPVQCNAFHADLHTQVPDAGARRGATAEGSVSDQQFSNTLTSTLSADTTTLRFQILAPAIKDTPVTVKETRRKDCAKCGARIPTHARFCLVCGAECAMLDGGSNMCKACGAEFKSGDNFCASCGTRVVNR